MSARAYTPGQVVILHDDGTWKQYDDREAAIRCAEEAEDHGHSVRWIDLAVYRRAVGPDLLTGTVMAWVAGQYEHEQNRSADPSTHTIPHDIGQSARAALARARGDRS